MASKGSFDAAAFFAAIDSVRRARNLNWRQVAGQALVSASTLTRMAQGRRPDVDSLAALSAWGDLSPDSFIPSKKNEASSTEPLAMISTYLRSDPHLSPEAAIAIEEVLKASYERLRRD
jgi:transcriptional regulator with XRE-family HTH domain